MLSKSTIIIRYAPLSIGGGSRAPTSTCPYVLSSSTSIHTPTSTKQHHADHDENVVAEFLVNECGLSPPQVSKVIRVCSSGSRTIYTQNARKVVELLKECGFTETQLKNTIVRNPFVLCLKAHEQIKPKIEFFKTLGFTEKDLGLSISRTPRLLGISLEKNINVKIPYFENLFGSRESMCKALRRSPYLLIADVEKNIKRKLEILKQAGIQDKLLSHLILSYPLILSSSAESLKLKIKNVKKLGIWEGSKTFTYALFAVTANGAGNIDKLKHMESLGLLEDEIRQLIRKAPLVLKFSTDKLQKNMDFLTQTAGLPPSIVVKYPYLLGYSIEKRLKPRYEVLKVLFGDLNYEQHPCLPSLLNENEKRFLNYVKRNPEAAGIYDIYRHKSIT